LKIKIAQRHYQTCRNLDAKLQIAFYACLIDLASAKQIFFYWIALENFVPVVKMVPDYPETIQRHGN